MSFSCIQERENAICSLHSPSLSRCFSGNLLGSAQLPTASLTLQMPLSPLPRLSDYCHPSQMMQCLGYLPSQTHWGGVNPCQARHILVPSWYFSNMVFLLPQCPGFGLFLRSLPHIPDSTFANRPAYSSPMNFILILCCSCSLCQDYEFAVGAFMFSSE